ncbi:type II toxin-antitoxin system VapC family toxin [uncultured Treponema sp.]|uniref:type II toxin-antitoxin system VapC family toxin n=1 Tax=uncultured Treponema sp. TaxID=162155 RepID=UPI0025E8C962|nr:type II toxin-antitoxin system VapC family toxin [uncultured Treponema sp.]
MAKKEHIVIDSDGNIEDSLPVAVIDTSYFMSTILVAYTSDENSEAQAFLQNLIEKNGQIIVPQLFWFEIGNVLLNAAKPKKDGSAGRITKAQLNEILMDIAALPIYTDFQPDSETRSRILSIALDEGLSYYDATYLELALRKDVALKTWDKALRQAAQNADLSI